MTKKKWITCGCFGLLGIIALPFAPMIAFVVFFFGWPFFQMFMPENKLILTFPAEKSTFTFYSRLSHPTGEYDRYVTLQEHGKHARKFELPVDSAGYNIVELYSWPETAGTRIYLTVRPNPETSQRKANTKSPGKSSASADYNPNALMNDGSFSWLLPRNQPGETFITSEPLKLGHVDTARMKWVPVPRP